MNEKSYIMRVNDNKQWKIVVWRSKKNAFSVQSDDKFWATTLEAISMLNLLLNLMIIFKAKQVQTFWVRVFLEVIFNVSENN